MLEAAGKTHIAEQEFASVLTRDFVVVRVDPWRRLAGVHSLRNPRQLAVARALWEARDEYAREIDTAPGRLMPDAALVAAARALPTSKRELAQIKEFTGRASRTQLERWWNAVEAGVATTELPPLRVPGESIPPARVWVDKNVEADKRLKASRAAMAELSEERLIPVENLLTPETLRRLAWKPPEPLTTESIRTILEDSGARPWQIDATTQLILDAFVEASQMVETPELPAS
jgi:ribonuclease D